MTERPPLLKVGLHWCDSPKIITLPLTKIATLKQRSILQRWLLLALVFFALSGGMGVVLRWTAVAPIVGVIFSFFRQGHSHVAFLGWGYLALVSLMIHQFLPSGSLGNRKYRWNLLLSAVFIAGMIISFPVWGYKAVSIILLSLFLVTSVVLVVYFLRDYFKTKQDGLSHYFLMAAFVWYLLSGIGPFALAPIVIFYGKGDLYHLAVYYYLHFLYNGFFAFGIGALFFKYIEDKALSFPFGDGKRFFWLTAVACLPAYLLSTLWVGTSGVIILIAFVAGLLQLVGAFYFFRLLRELKLDGDKFALFFLRMAFISYALKVLLQLLSAIPVLTRMVYEAKSFVVIGYIHLVTLGVISSFIIAWMGMVGKMPLQGKISQIGGGLFIIGFVLSEALLFVRGAFQWFLFTGFHSFYLWLATFSSLLLIGILFLLMGSYRERQCR